MLLDEERAANQNVPLRMSYEIDPKNPHRQSASFADQSRSYHPTQMSSMLVEPKRTEPLITKAYDAFRKHKSVNKVDNLVPTEEYLDE